MLRLLGVAAIAASTTPLLAALASRFGWVGAAHPRERERKREGRAVPAVGGAALLLALAAAREPPWMAPGNALWGRWLPGPGWILASLGLVFAVGAWDDRRALAPAGKLLAQVLGLAPLALGAALGHGPLAALCVLLAGVGALNLLNTFDNADGALAGLAALGFAFAAPAVSAACVGFLPWNLDAARARNRPSAAPSAYLGDAGAFVLAFQLLLVPGAVGLLLVPALDLARLSVGRWRRGSRPWVGDREHLAHRLERRLWPRWLVAAALGLAAWPACQATAHALEAGFTPSTGLALLASVGAYGLLLALSRRGTRGPEGRPCSGARAPE